MAETKSIQQALLNDAAAFVQQDIAYVVINDNIQISDFTVKQVSDNAVTLKYEVTPSMTNLITSIKLMKVNGDVLTQSIVYVPVTQSIVSKHTITVKEGV